MNFSSGQYFIRGTSRWYSLKSKPGKKDEKYRGEIEVKVTFIVQSKSESQSALKISRAGSIKHLASSVGTLYGRVLRVLQLQDYSSNKKYFTSSFGPPGLGRLRRSFHLPPVHLFSFCGGN